MSRPPQLGSASRLGAFIAATALSTAVLWRAGGPPLDSFSARTDQDPATVVIATVRLCGLAIGGWLTIVTVIAVLARIAGAHLLSRAVERLLPAAARRLVHLTFAATLTGGMLGSVPAMATNGPRHITTGPATTAAVTGDLTNGQRWPVLPAPTTTRRGTVSVPAPGRPSLPSGTVAATSTTRRPRAAARPTTVSFEPGLPVAHAPTTISARITPDNRTTDTWTVGAGDHFWSIAEHIVGRTTPHPSEEHVRRYWLRLIEANRGRLHDPRNPDLIFVGQELLLPS